MQTNGNRHHSEALADTNVAWAEHVNALVNQATMDVLHAVADELTKLMAGVNEDFNKSIDVCDAKIKAAIATCERASAEIRSNVPAMIDEAVAKHISQAMANIHQPVDGAPGPAGPPGKLEIVKEYIEGQVYYDRDLVVGNDGALYQADRDTAAGPPHTDWRCITRAGRNGNDAVNFRIDGTYDPDARYHRLSIVMLNGSSFVARYDDPGPCPGNGWQLFTSVGKRGQQGPKGERGPAGPLAVAPRIASTEIDANYNLIILYADHSCDTIPLRPAFERFQMEIGG